MQEQEGSAFFDERLTTLAAVQEGLARHGYLFYPIAREHAEGLVTGPLLHRIHTQVSKRGFGNVAGTLLLTFSGYARDPRELFEIPEARAYWRRLDAELPELPALLAFLPQLRWNGPGMHLILLGAIDAVLDHPAASVYDVRVVDAARIIADATSRIRQAGRKYQLSQPAITMLTDHFLQGARYHR